jgi:hypothetical protein
MVNGSNLDNFRQKFRDGPLNTMLRIVSVVVIFVILVSAFYLYKFIFPAPYIATQDNFKIVFPNPPKVNNVAPKKVGSSTESSRIYSDINDTTGTAYTVYVTYFSTIKSSSLSKAETLAFLQADIENLAKNDSTNLSNGNTLIFKNQTAVEAKLTPTDSSDASSNIIGFFNGQRLYILIGTGISDRQFNIFINRFAFLS